MATLGDLKTWAANNGLSWNDDTYTKAYNALNNVNTNNPKTTSSSTSSNITTDMSNAASAAKTQPSTATTVTGDVVTYDPITGRILTTIKSNTTTPITNTSTTKSDTTTQTTGTTNTSSTKSSSTDATSSDTVSNSGQLSSSILTDKDDAFIKSTLQSIKDKGLFDTELKSGYDLNDIKSKLVSMYNSTDADTKSRLNKIRADISNERLARGMGTSWKFLGTTGTSEKTTTSTGTTIDNSSGTPEYTGKTGDTWDWDKTKPGQYKTSNSGDYQTIGYLADGSIVYVRYGEYVPGVSATKPTSEQILTYNNSIQDANKVTEWMNSGTDLPLSDWLANQAKNNTNTNSTTKTNTTTSTTTPTTPTTQTTSTTNNNSESTSTDYYKPPVTQSVAKSTKSTDYYKPPVTQSVAKSTTSTQTPLQLAESKASTALNEPINFSKTFSYAWNSKERMYIANLAGIASKDYVGSTAQNTQIKNFLKTNYKLSI